MLGRNTFGVESGKGGTSCRPLLGGGGVGGVLCVGSDFSIFRCLNGGLCRRRIISTAVRTNEKVRLHEIRDDVAPFCVVLLLQSVKRE